jgi:hypothetical protein
LNFKNITNQNSLSFNIGKRMNRFFHIILFLFTFVSCAFTTIVLLFDLKQPTAYSYLFLLPCMFFLFSSLFGNVIFKIQKYNIGVFIIVVQMYIRNVITPLVMRFGDYTSIFIIKDASNIYNAVFLMIYEMVSCFFVIYFFVQRKIKRERAPLQINIRPFKTSIASTVLFILSLLCVVLWFAVPLVQGAYRTIFELVASSRKDSSYDYTQYAVSGSISRIGATLFYFLFSILRVAIPAQIIMRLAVRKKNTIRFYISLFIILLQLLFIPEAVAVPVITIFILFIIVFDLYPQKRYALYLLVISLPTFVIVVFAMEYTKISAWYGFKNISQYMSYWFNSYVTGVDNVAMSNMLPERNRIVILLHTIISAIPFRTTILPQTIGWDTINTLFNELPRCGGQIVSTIGAGQYFFSFIFAPIPSIIFTYISVYYGNKYKTTNNVWKRIAYLYMCIEVALGLGFYNIPITLVHIVEVGIPLLLIARFYGKDYQEDAINKVCLQKINKQFIKTNVEQN